MSWSKKVQGEWKILEKDLPGLYALLQNSIWIYFHACFPVTDARQHVTVTRIDYE